jgi:hypothetical protein
MNVKILTGATAAVVAVMATLHFSIAAADESVATSLASRI